MEILGFHLRRGCSRQRDRRVLGQDGLRRHTGIRSHRNYFDHQREPSFSSGQRIDWKSAGGARGQAGPDGEILVRGSGVSAGYWTGHELQPLVSKEGWYGTGDIGERDTAGNLYFKGRKKDVIVTSAGMNVYPEDLEAALRRQPEVKDCVVIALPQDGNAEPCAVLILRGVDADPEPVVKRANETLAEYQRMRNWFVWPDNDFPRTSTLKPRGNEYSAIRVVQVWQRQSWE